MFDNFIDCKKFIHKYIEKENDIKKVVTGMYYFHFQMNMF